MVRKDRTRVKIKIGWTVLFIPVLCAFLCGCGEKEGQVLWIGREGEEVVSPPGAEAQEAAGEGQNAAGGDAAGETPALQPEGNGTAEMTGAGSADDGTSEILVHVCGAVVSPGVVSLPEGARAQDALDAAGGFAEDAGRSYVNLAGRVSDGQQLYFPTMEEAERLSETEGLKGSPQEADSGLVNINTADVAALCTLPGIGESRARDIIAYREANGAFESCEEIMEVSGIKASVYGKISGRITVK